MDRLTEALYGRDRFAVEPGVPEEAQDAFQRVLGFRMPTETALGRVLGRLCACPSGSRIVVDGYQDDREAAILVSSRFEGTLATVGECDLRTQVVLIRSRYETARCRLELADFSPRGAGIGIRYFGKLVSRLGVAGFSRIALEAAGNPGGAYNGYITWALFGANLILPRDLVDAAHKAGFPESDSTHELFRHPGGAQWWFKNGRTSEAVFNLAEDSRHNRLLREYMIDKGVELS